MTTGLLKLLTQRTLESSDKWIEEQDEAESLNASCLARAKQQGIRKVDILKY